MKRKRQLVCLLPSFSEDTYYRDMFLVPYYIGKINDMLVSVVFHGDGKQIDSEYRGVKLFPLQYKGNYDWFSFKGEWYLIWYAFKYAKKMDVLVRFHFSYQTALIGLLYKLRNPKGVFYVKGDGYGLYSSLFRTDAWFPGQKYRNQNSLWIKLKNFIIRKILGYMGEVADKVSVETSSVYEQIKKEKAFKKKPNKLVLMLNGFDEECLPKGFDERTFSEKENIILTSGRIGASDKNYELLLKALNFVDLRDWKVVFLGPREKIDSFDNELQSFYAKNPNKKDQIVFTGAIWNRLEYYEWFNKSKVFVHTSPRESFGIVFVEAYRFKNYIISTPVGIAPQLIESGNGRLYKHNNEQELASCLQEVINGNVDLESKNLSFDDKNKAFSYNIEIMKLGFL